MALYSDGWLQETQPQEWAKLAAYKGEGEHTVLERVARLMDTDCPVPRLKDRNTRF